jgi:HD-like signal output (HDOD) protein
VTTCSAPPFALRTTPDDVVRQLRHLPSAPRVLPKLKRLLSDGNSSIHDIVALVRLDPGIAARVLQVGNSAFFSQGVRCYTVEEAVHRVGYDQIYELVAAAVASQVLVRPLTSYGIEADDLWRSSITCAIAAECLAEGLNIDRDIAYTVGLLHRVGLVAIDEWLSRKEPDLRLVSTGLPLETCEHERKILGFHNAEAGAALLRLWEFPPVMAEPVRWQYLPNATAAHLQLATLLHIAKWVRSAVMEGSQNVTAPDAAGLRRLCLTSVQLTKIVTEVAECVEAVGALLNDPSREGTKLRFPGGERLIASS